MTDTTNLLDATVTHEDVREASRALDRGPDYADQMSEWALECGRVFGQALVDRLAPAIVRQAREGMVPGSHRDVWERQARRYCEDADSANTEATRLRALCDELEAKLVTLAWDAQVAERRARVEGMRDGFVDGAYWGGAGVTQSVLEFVVNNRYPNPAPSVADTPTHAQQFGTNHCIVPNCGCRNVAVADTGEREAKFEWRRASHYKHALVDEDGKVVGEAQEGSAYATAYCNGHRLGTYFSFDDAKRSVENAARIVAMGGGK